MNKEDWNNWFKLKTMRTNKVNAVNVRARVCACFANMNNDNPCKWRGRWGKKRIAGRVGAWAHREQMLIHVKCNYEFEMFYLYLPPAVNHFNFYYPFSVQTNLHAYECTLFALHEKAGPMGYSFYDCFTLFGEYNPCAALLSWFYSFFAFSNFSQSACEQLDKCVCNSFLLLHAFCIGGWLAQSVIRKLADEIIFSWPQTTKRFCEFFGESCSAFFRFIWFEFQLEPEKNKWTIDETMWWEYLIHSEESIAKPRNKNSKIWN